MKNNLSLVENFLPSNIAICVQLEVGTNSAWNRKINLKNIFLLKTKQSETDSDFNLFLIGSHL